MDIWQGLQRGDSQAIAIFSVAIAIGAIVLFIVQRLVRNIVARRVRAHRVADAGFGELAAMKKQGLLTDEEARLVRAALARRFTQEQEPKAAEPEEPPGAALARLAIEAERLEQELRARKSTAAPAAIHRPVPASPHSNKSPIPGRLRGLVGKPALELEELASAGFITEEDLGLLKEHAAP